MWYKGGKINKRDGKEVKEIMKTRKTRKAIVKKRGKALFGTAIGGMTGKQWAGGRKIVKASLTGSGRSGTVASRKMRRMR